MSVYNKKELVHYRNLKLVHLKEKKGRINQRFKGFSELKLN